jgi:glycosyltransferase involved in cell wall biosynthesis
LFWGLADRRLDPEICLALANEMTLRIVGPRENVEPRLLGHRAIEWIGAVPHAQLPQEAARADVLVMPYAELPVTAAMQPLKLLEYLATGLPVVATPIPANRAWADAMDLSGTPDAFVSAVVARTRTGLPGAQRQARERLNGESWEAKADTFEQLCLSAA